MNFAIIGAGAWGTAMAVHLVRTGHSVTLAARRMDHALDLASSRENRDYLPGIHLEYDLQIGSELKPVLMEAEVVLFAVPSAYLRDAAQKVAAVRSSARQLRLAIALCKGLERETNLLPGEVLAQALPGLPRASLSGPTYAREVAEGKPTAIVLAGDVETPEPLIGEVQAAVSGGALRVYTSPDLTGVELGGCLKNVYAIASGTCQGLELGDNARAALLTRSLAEMVRLGTSLGGNQETFFGLSGFGDLIATCNGAWSRNRTFGERIARGESIDELIGRRKLTVEGYRTVYCFHEICRQRGIEAPIMEQIYAVLHDEVPPMDALAALMARDLKAEG